LTALLAESEGVGEERGSQQQADELDGLFDEDNEEEEEYKEGSEEEEVATENVVKDLFGDVDDIENIEREAKEEGACENLNRSKEDLQGL